MNNLSIIITTYNDSSYLSNAIKSIASQDLPPSELIVVDDGSSDNHKNKIKHVIDTSSYIVPFPVLLIHKSNGGPSSARNLGISRSNGKYIAFLDADDHWESDRISKLLPKISQTQEHCAAIYTGATLGDHSKSRKEKYISNIEIDRSQSALIGKTNGVACGAPFYIFKKEALIEVNGFDETIRWNEDLDLLLRIVGKGYTLLGIDDYSFCRNERATSHSKNKTRESYKHIIKFLEKNKELGNLSNEEYLLRKKYNSLIFLKEALKNLSPKDVKYYFEISFSNEPPTTYKQKIIYFTSVILLKYFRNI